MIYPDLTKKYKTISSHHAIFGGLVERDLDGVDGTFFIDEDWNCASFVPDDTEVLHEGEDEVLLTPAEIRDYNLNHGTDLETIDDFINEITA